MYQSENFLLTFDPPSPFPSPHWGEGGGEGKFQIFLARIYLELGIWIVQLNYSERTGNDESQRDQKARYADPSN
jgi:hypothetical protein